MQTKDINQFKKISNATLKTIVKVDSEIRALKKEMEKEPKEIYTKEEIAFYCNVTEKTIDRWRRKGLKYMQNGRNGKVLFKLKEVNNFLNKK